MKTAAILIAIYCICPGGVEKAHSDDADKPYKNVHYLMHLTRPQLHIEMSFIRGSLGVHCDFCHVVDKEGWKWDSDDKPTKNMARKMIGMVLEINRATFNGEPVVTCYTCHQGKMRPNGLPPLPQPAPPYPTVVPDSGLVDIAPQQILDRYVQATGGRSRSVITNANTLILKGTTDETWKRKVVPLEIYYKAPNKWLIVILDPNGTLTQAFDGAHGWTQEGVKVSAMSDREVAFFLDTVTSLQFFPAPPSSQEMKVRKIKIDDRDVFALEYQISDGLAENYYFDAQTNLLIRKSRFTRSPLGTIPEEINYLDYKQLDGANIPHTLQSNYMDPWIGGTRKFADVQVNAPVDDAKFQMPESKP